MSITVPRCWPACPAGRRGALGQLLHEDLRAAGRLVHAALWADEALALLDGCGWNDGGCVVLADAFSRLLAGRARTVALLAPTRRPWAQHALVDIDVDGVAWYLDGGGAATRDEVLHHWHTIERVSDPMLVDLDDDPETPRNADLAGRLATFLSDRLAAADGTR